VRCGDDLEGFVRFRECRFADAEAGEVGGTANPRDACGIDGYPARGQRNLDARARVGRNDGQPCRAERGARDDVGPGGDRVDGVHETAGERRRHAPSRWRSLRLRA
jgi:hypothetical protein